jgi:hypothetical protein
MGLGRDDPPAQFQLDGSFASDSWGRTILSGQEPFRWQIREGRPGVGFIIEVCLEGAVVAFEWSFNAVSNQRTGSIARRSCDLMT